MITREEEVVSGQCAVNYQKLCDRKYLYPTLSVGSMRFGIVAITRRLISPCEIPIAIIFALYATLMLYQQYHTVGDIVLTGVVMGPATWFIHVAGQSIGNCVRRKVAPQPQ